VYYVAALLSAGAFLLGRRVRSVKGFEGDDVIVDDPERGAPERMPFAAYAARYGGFAVVAGP